MGNIDNFINKHSINHCMKTLFEFCINSGISVFYNCEISTLSCYICISVFTDPISHNCINYRYQFHRKFGDWNFISNGGPILFSIRIYNQTEFIDHKPSQ